MIFKNKLVIVNSSSHRGQPSFSASYLPRGKNQYNNNNNKINNTVIGGPSEKRKCGSKTDSPNKNKISHDSTPVATLPSTQITSGPTTPSLRTLRN